MQTRARNFGAAVLIVAAGILCAGPVMGQEKPVVPPPPPAAVAPEGMLRFSFGPIGYKGMEAQPNFREGFTIVNVTTDYAKERGFGWVGLQGDVKKDWVEVRGGLSSRARKGPNDLMAGWIAGGAPFEVDVPPGKYAVTACLGDWGEYEFFPFGSFTLLFQGKEVLKRACTPDNKDQWILKHKYTDYERGQKLFDRYVKSRFDVVTQEVDAPDGKITIVSRVDAGPKEYTGAMNYVVITPAARKAEHAKYLADLETMLRYAFDKQFPMAKVNEAYCDGSSEAEKAAGFGVIGIPPGDKVHPWTAGSNQNHVKQLSGYAARGQFEAMDFCVVPLKDLGSLTCACSDLAGPNGAKIPAGEVKVGYVKYWDAYNRGDRGVTVEVEPSLVMDRSVIARAEARVTRQWWLTVHVPEQAPGGTYQGMVTLTAEKGGSVQIPVSFNVIPLTLDGPGAVMTLNYSRPWKDLYFGDDMAWGADVEKELTLLRDHGMNSVAMDAKLPLKDDDTGDWERYIDLYQKLGFDQPIYFAGTMNLYGKFKNLLDPAEQEAFVNVLRKLEEAAKKKNQKVIYSLCDEGTNDGFEARSGLAARIVREKAPEIQTIGDINGYRELMQCAPYLRAAAFNNGWGGSYGTSRYPHDLMSAPVFERVKALGCDPWFVNGGKGRYPFGVFMWKMEKLGVKGKCEWHFFASTGDPYNPFDSNQFNSFGSLVFPSCIPTLLMEDCREGIDDLRYARTLERVVAGMAGEKDPLIAGRVQSAKETLEYWLDQIPDRMMSGRNPDGSVKDAGADFPPVRLAEFRKEIAWHLCRLLKLDCPGLYSPETLLASWEKGERTGWTRDIVPAAEHATRGEQSGKMTFDKQHTYFDSWGGTRPKDWRGYASCRFDVFNPQAQDVALVLTLRDQLAANIQAESSARKTIVFTLKPGNNSLSVPLVGITDDSGKRPLDLTCMFNIILTLKDAGAPEGTTLFIDNMRLNQEP